MIQQHFTSTPRTRCIFIARTRRVLRRTANRGGPSLLGTRHGYAGSYQWVVVSSQNKIRCPTQSCQRFPKGTSNLLLSIQSAFHQYQNQPSNDKDESQRWFPPAMLATNETKKTQTNRQNNENQRPRSRVRVFVSQSRSNSQRNDEKEQTAACPCLCGITTKTPETG